MKKAIIFLDVPDQLDVAQVYGALQHQLPLNTDGGDCSIEILPEQINTNARLFFWHRVCDRDVDGILTDEQKVTLTIRAAERDDFVDEKINQNIDYDINEIIDQYESEDGAYKNDSDRSDDDGDETAHSAV